MALANAAAPERADNTDVIGDAAHAPSPSSGQGASMAIEDAVVLAKALREDWEKKERSVR
jgi:2-polyprenyl-6-methoxyphenol hydroxylase-like FAD-dependent oxidoreductase